MQQAQPSLAGIEAKYPRLTTPRPIQPPVIVIYNPDWAETFSGPGIKEDANLTKVTTFWCKRARRTFLKYLRMETDTSWKNGVVSQKYGFLRRISSPCNCTLAVPDVAMGNENQQFEELSG
uniref:Spaetzle domain-containing protein n=1 Tax=Globodera pallida TaxID=36090 RepID=A0A183CDQ6_GLOPA